MTTTNELMMAVNNIQPNAQESLPVLPNNGNPRGANNMRPTTPGMAESEAAAPQPNAVTPPTYFYPWLQPSPHMDAVNQMLQAPMYRGGHTYTDAPVPMMQPTPTMGFNDGSHLPILPQTGGIMPPREVPPQAGGLRDDTNVDQFRMVLPRAMMR